MCEFQTPPVSLEGLAVDNSQHRFRLYLASASPRRADILRAADLPFTLVPSTYEEPPPNQQDHAVPAAWVMRLAREKAAHAVLPPEPAAELSHSTRLVLGADTIVWHDGEVLGKPADADGARAMLKRLRGHTHQVFTGVSLRVITGNGPDEFHSVHDTTTVEFGLVSDRWIDAYVRSGEPMDKAGSYAAQGRGAALVTRINGDFWNVVGLPLASLARLLETVGAPLESWWEKSYE